MYLQNLLRREPLKLVDGGEVQRTFLYIKDAIEAVVLMIVRILSLLFGLFM
jgi:UDP-apiose/xylose synthase